MERILKQKDEELIQVKQEHYDTTKSYKNMLFQLKRVKENNLQLSHRHNLSISTQAKYNIHTSTNFVLFSAVERRIR